MFFLTMVVGIFGAVLFGLAIRDHASAWADMILTRSTWRFWRGAFFAALMPGPIYVVLPGPLQVMFHATMPASMLVIAVVACIVSLIVGVAIQLCWIRCNVRMSGPPIRSAPDPAWDLVRASIDGIVEGAVTFVGIISVIARMAGGRIAYAYARTRK